MDRARLTPDHALVERFASDLSRLTDGDGRIGLAVSGGGDSLALLLLAAAALPSERLRVATVDHGLRAEAAEEAAMVAGLCELLALPHDTLGIEWKAKPTSQVQAMAREARYKMLRNWAAVHRLSFVATAHQADDQAETLVMRLSRGAGLSGLAGVRATRLLPNDGDWQVHLIRPLLGWRRSELAGIVAAAGLTPVDDPTNHDKAHERTRARGLLSAVDGPDPLKVSASASHLADAEEAIAHAEPLVLAGREVREGAGWRLDPRGLPREWCRRLVLAFYADHADRLPRGPALDRLLEALACGETVTLGAFKWTGGATWRADSAPPRRG